MERIDNPYAGLGEYGAWNMPPEPDILKVERGDQVVVLGRCGHSHDPYGSTIRSMVGAWDNHFYPHVRSNPTEAQVWLEGLMVSPTSQHPLHDIKLIGERALSRWLSEHFRIPLFSGSPETPYKFANLLEQGFAAEAIMYYLNLRHIVQWDRSLLEKQDSKWDIRLHMQKVMQRYAFLFRDFDKNEWQDFSFMAAHKKLFPDGPDDPYDPFFAGEQTVHYWETDTEVQKVALAWNILTDQKLLDTLIRILDRGKSVFTYFGWQHGYRQEKDIAALGDYFSIHRPSKPLEYITVADVNVNPPPFDRDDPVFCGPLWGHLHSRRNLADISGKLALKRDLVAV